MMGRRQKLKTGIEFDVVYKAPLCVLSRSKVKKRVKSEMNRRWRRKTKNEITSSALFNLGA